MCQLLSRYTHISSQISERQLTCDLYGIGIHDGHRHLGALHDLYCRDQVTASTSLAICTCPARPVPPSNARFPVVSKVSNEVA